jgi:Ca2+-binding RTX toxin-like protein
MANSDGNAVAAFGINYTGDTLYGYSPDPDFIQTTVINATLVGDAVGAASWTMLGGTGNDSIIGGSNADYIIGDRNGFAPVGRDTIFGGDGDDTIYADYFSNNDAGEQDYVDGGNGDDYIEGGVHNDTIIGGSGDNTLFGNDANDDISAADGNNDISGGNGDDTITSGLGNNTISGGNGDDIISVGIGNNDISGGNGDDSITSGSGNDTISGGNGDDTIRSGGGADFLLGGADNDLFLFANGDLTASVTLDGGLGSDTLAFDANSDVIDSAFTNVSNIEALTTANGVGSSLSLDGFASDAGVSTVQGGNGDDTFTLGSNFDTAVTLLGGAGNDDFTVNSYSQISSNYIDGGANTDTLNIVTSLGASNSYEPIVSTNVSNIEILQLGETATNYVNIGDSNGDWGIASVYGGANVDNNINAAAIGVSINLFGGNNSDQLIAGSNGDVIQGWLATTNTSSDTLTGGTGNDDFVLGNNTDNAYGQSGGGSPIAYIRDFDAGGDILTVSSFGGTVVAGDYNTDSVGVPVGYNTRLFLNSSNTDTIAFLNVSGVFNTATDLNVVV